MRSQGRFSLVALLAGAIVAVSAPAAQASFGVESFFGANCKTSTCGPKSPTSEYFTQAAGHPNFGITDFRFNSVELGPLKARVPIGNVRNVRVDAPPGLSTDPQAVPKCSQEEFKAVEVAPGTFTGSACAEATTVGANVVTVAVEPKPGVFANVTLEGKVFNLEQPNGLPLQFGVALSLEPLEPKAFKGLFAHTLINGGVEWSGDYHQYFEIAEISRKLPLLESRLIFEGNKGTGGILTSPSSCNPRGPATTTRLHVESYEGQSEGTQFEAPVGTEDCKLVPFEPSFQFTPEATRSDRPAGAIAELALPHDPNPEHLDSSTLKVANVTLPEGMTLNPAVAAGLQACTPAQIGIGTVNPVACPEASKIGTVAIEVPTLPAKSLAGNVYLGAPASGPITGPPYTIYLDAESARYGQSVRLKGSIVPDESTGRLTATFSENPEAPFSAVILHFTGGPLAPLANPLVCGTATTEASFSPYTGQPDSLRTSAFTVDADGSAGACASPLPFSPTQSTQNQSGNAGAHTSYTFQLARSDGQQYLAQAKVVLPPGLLGAIPSVKPCEEPQAREGTCTSESQIGTATLKAGSGPTPFTFSGPVHLTGPYNGAPFGLSIAVPAVAGPFNLGTIVTRATMNFDPYTARVTLSSVLPRIVGGIPLRLREFSVAIDRQGFLSNPTSCGALATETTLTGFTPGSSALATRELSSPFGVGNCSALAFKPSFKASTSTKTSKANGASLETTINQGAGEANVRSVVIRLPRQLPSRLTTLQKACPEATFAANPSTCPAGSLVGSARANTPVLPGKLTGPAYLVSHAAAAFPDLELVLQANGVRTILVGSTNIKKSITTIDFPANPDVPVSSITINLPTGPHSALAAYGNLCVSPLLVPTTLTAQNGKQIKQNTRISVAGCAVRIVGHKTIRNTAYLIVQTYAAGRISASGAHLSSVFRRLNTAAKATTLKVALSRGARRPLRTRIRVGFVPLRRGLPSSAAYVTVRFG
jgi:hypothetical protein